MSVPQELAEANHAIWRAERSVHYWEAQTRKHRHPKANDKIRLAEFELEQARDRRREIREALDGKTE